MLLIITLASAAELIESPEVVWEDRVVPAQFPEFVDSPYRPGYDWLFVYERKLAAFLERWLRPHRYALIGEKGILCEALSNAYAHAHNKDPRLPIFVNVLKGRKGLLVQIQDSGKGFDVRMVYRKYAQRRQYFHTAGNGIRLMAESSIFGIFHDEAGTTFHLLYFFDGSLNRVPPACLFDVSP